MSDTGQRRRASDNNTTTHDLVIRIDENVKFIKLEAEEFKNLFEKHLEDDKINFKKVHDRIDPIKNTLLKVNGAWMVIVFIFGLLLKFWK